MTDNSEFAKKRFWDRYIAVLDSNNVKKSAQRWYVVRVEEYIKFYPDKRLQEHDQDNVNAFFEEIGRKQTINSWQYYQVIDALHSLFCQMLKVSWCQAVDWDYWKGSAQSLSKNHPTIARDTIKQGNDQSLPLIANKISPEVFVQIRKEHNEVIQSLIAKIRSRGYSIRTEQTYESWLCRFIAFHKGKFPIAMGAHEVTAFLEYLAVERNVSANTQNQALNALIFFYTHVLDKQLQDLGDFARAKRPKTLPVVMSKSETMSLLDKMDGVYYLMAALLYGTGMRLMECIRLRVKDIDFDYQQITVRQAKGNKDRVVPLPEILIDQLKSQLESTRKIYDLDIEEGHCDVYLPEALSRKYPKASAEWLWQYVFPSKRLSVDPRSKTIRRHHIHENGLQKKVKKAAQSATINKPIKCHTLRHYADNRIMPSKVILLI